MGEALVLAVCLVVNSELEVVQDLRDLTLVHFLRQVEETVNILGFTEGLDVYYRFGNEQYA